MMPAAPPTDRLELLLRTALPERRDLAVRAVESLGGYQHELWAVEVEWAGRSRLLWTPPEREQLVVRLYRSPLTWWSTNDRAKPTRELALAPRLGEAGLPVPPVYAGGDDTPGGLGQYLVMGRAPGAPWFTPEVDVRAVLTPLIEPHARNLARLHAIPLDAVAAVPLPRRSVAEAIAHFRALAAEAAAVEVVAMADRLAEIAAGRPELPPTLVHGTPDFGNVLIDPAAPVARPGETPGRPTAAGTPPTGSPRDATAGERLTAWLDWEDSAIADPRWDVAAVVAYLRVFKLADLGQRFVDHYRAASGRPVDDLTLWLALIALRGWALTCWLQAWRAAGTAPEFPGLDHWLFSLPRYRAAAQSALQRVEGWARLQSQCQAEAPEAPASQPPPPDSLAP